MWFWMSWVRLPSLALETMSKKVAFFLCLFGFSYCVNLPKSGLKKEIIKTQPIAVRKVFSKVVSNKDSSYLLTIYQTLEMFDDKGMTIFKVIQKKNYLGKNEIKETKSFAYIRTYDDAERLIKTTVIFGNPLNYRNDFLNYSPKDNLLSVASEKFNPDSIVSTTFLYQNQMLIEKITSQSNNKRVLKETYQYFPNFQIKSLKREYLKAESKPILTFEKKYAYLKKEKDMFYNRAASINWDSFDKSERFSYAESLLAKERFSLKYLLDKNSHVIGKSKIDLDRRGNVGKVTYYDEDIPKYILEIQYFSENQSKLVDEIFQEMTKGPKINGPKNLKEAQQFLSK